MTTTTDTPAVREIPTSHLVRLPDGSDLEFGTVWTGYDHDQLKSALVWTHDLSDAEVLLRARAYLEGPFAQQCDDPYGLAGGDQLWAREFWPDVEDDLSGYVRRVWGRWHVVTEEEEKRHNETANEFDGDLEAGTLRWMESAEPGEGLRPVCVIGLKP